MKNLDWKKKILDQNKQIVSNITNSNKEVAREFLRKKGYIEFSKAANMDFKKVGWDVYQRKEDEDGGQIWTVSDIDGEKWLVCYTDDTDEIVKRLSNAYMNEDKISKTSSMQKKAVIMNPGDFAEITPWTSQSINYKYKGKQGTVTTATPDRSELTFQDGTSMWVENRDLTTVKDARELESGDTVRMFARPSVEGVVTKFNNGYVTFENPSGQQFSSRVKDIVKIVKAGKYALVVQNIFTDPDNPDEAKILREYMKSQQTQPPVQTPGAATTETGLSPFLGEGTLPPKNLPAIKNKPTEDELARGLALPAGEVGMASKEYDLIGFIKHGRVLGMSDEILKKSTGEKGRILVVNFDRKLGKFYMVDFGGEQPRIEYDTDIMKLNTQRKLRHPSEEPPVSILPTEYGPQPFHQRHSSKIAEIIDTKYDNLKTTAMEFVNGMVNQALKDYQETNKSEKVSSNLEDALVKQAIKTYMSKYMPIDYRQIMSSEDKNKFSEWLYTSATLGEPEEAPTTQEFTVEKEPGDMWDLEKNYRTEKEKTQSYASEDLKDLLNDHIQVDIVSPTTISSVKERDDIFTQVADTLNRSGLDLKVAEFISHNIVSIGVIDNTYTRRSLNKQFGYEPIVVNQIMDHTMEVLADAVFINKSKKFALDLPGMETLRGGGGGYPAGGGMNIPPMEWTVKNPTQTPIDPSDLQIALQENLENQSKPFEEAAPKINVELDTENKRIVIDYGQEEAPIEIAGAGAPPTQEPTQGPQIPPPATNIPTSPGATELPGGTPGGATPTSPVNF